MSRFVDGEPMKSQVAITTAKTYDQAERAVEEAINLLGGPEKICTSKDIVMIKPNMVSPSEPDMGDTTHPAVIGALVKILKRTGAKIRVGEQAAWSFPTALAFEVTGIGKAATEAGGEIVDWEKDKRVAVEVPDPRSIQRVKLPLSVVESTVFIHAPKMKVNYMYASVTLAIKGLLGLLDNQDRGQYHRTVADMAWATCDIAKAIAPKHRLSLIDGIMGVEGEAHLGYKVYPGVIVASRDMVAVEAVGASIMGFHHLESPGVQLGMKAGLGTGELSEIEILGKTIEEVRHPFKRPLRRYVSKWKNIKEYIGGTCEGCLLTLIRTPFVVDPKKTYALITGTRVFIPDHLEADEAWLIGTCAVREDHQFPGFMSKLKGIKTIRQFSGCPGITALHHQNKKPVTKGTPYELPDQISIDAVILGTLPDLIRENARKGAEARREGRMSLEETKKLSLKEKWGF